MARVFVSYTHDSDQHRDNVRRMVEDLIANGVDVRFDRQVHGTPPLGWPAWMEEEIREADFVLVVCTENYLRRYQGREKPGVGRGGAWEGALIRDEFYAKSGRNDKYAAILFDRHDDKYQPEPLRSHTHYVMPRDSEALLRWLTGQPAYISPPLGKVPDLPPDP